MPNKNWLDSRDADYYFEDLREPQWDSDESDLNTPDYVGESDQEPPDATEEKPWDDDDIPF